MNDLSDAEKVAQALDEEWAEDWPNIGPTVITLQQEIARVPRLEHAVIVALDTVTAVPSAQDLVHYMNDGALAPVLVLNRERTVICKQLN